MASDLSQLQAVDEASISANCKKRYDGDEIYTSCGRLLVALNPYKPLPIYSADAIGKYNTDASALPPHIYSVAASAYKGMLQTGKSQSVIISGESGAGKTESAKFFLEFMATVGRGAGSLHARVLRTNPVMEAFGNASTALNDNSSRFGKFMRLEFSTTGKLRGASLRTYLLEKTRVVRQGASERNYHVFYHLAAGAPPDVRKEAAVPSPKGWAFLNGGEAADAKRHGARFAEVAAALSELGVSAEQARAVWATVGAVLHVGNLAVVEAGGASSGDGASAALRDAAPLKAACAALGLQLAQAQEAMLQRKIKVGAEVIAKPNTPAEALAVRDALAKALFAALFDWIVRTANASLKATSDAAEATADKVAAAASGAAGVGARRPSGSAAGGAAQPERFIGAVDVFGFESFPTNSLEQLCINYANERLQRLFVGAVFESQLEVYRHEGLSVGHIPFPDNSAVVALIDGPPAEPGVLQILSEECVLGASSDKGFLGRVVQKFGVDKPHASFVKGKGSQLDSAFAIKHFAAEVTYSVAGFVDKNKDPLPVDLSMLLRFSSTELVAQMFAPPAEAPQVGGRKVFRSAKFVGVIDGFRTSLNELVATLERTHTHFVRCIKPNMTKAPAAFDDAVVRRQLLTAGVVQAVHAARAGYPDHVPFGTLGHSYALLLPKEQWGGELFAKGADPKKGAEAVLRASGISAERYTFGKRLAFLGVGVLDELEGARHRYIEQRAVFMQAHVRTALAKRLARQLRDEKAKAALARAKEEAAAAAAAAAEAERQAIAEAEERARREAEEAQKASEEAAKKQQKFQIARQKSFERQARRAKAAEGAPAADGAAPPPPKREPEGGPPKAVVTDVGWKAGGDAEDALDEAAAQAAQEEYGFTNPAADVLEYAEYLGMDVAADRELLWIADEALSAPEPHGWEQRVDPGGNVFYYHEGTGMLLPEHPLDHHYQQLYYQLKESMGQGARGGGAGGGGGGGGGSASARRDSGGGGGGGGGSSARAASDDELDAAPLPLDLGALPASLLLSRGTLRRPSLKEMFGSVTGGAGRTHVLNLLTYELTVPVTRKPNGLGVGLTVDNIIVEMDPNGSFADTRGQICVNDKIIAIDGERLGTRMLKDVVRPKPEHQVTLLFTREASLAPAPRESRATLARRAPASMMRVKELPVALKRKAGQTGFTLDPTNVVIELTPGTDAAAKLRVGDKVCEVDGLALEHTRFGEVADAQKPGHKLKVARIKPPKGGGTPTPSQSGGKKRPKSGGAGRIHFREVSLTKTSPSERIGVLFHRHDDAYDLTAFGRLDGATMPIIKKVDPDTVGARAGLQPGDVVLAVNGLSGMNNFQVVEMIRTLHGTITFLVAAAPAKAGGSTM